MPPLIDFFKDRLQLQLPHHDIRKEGLSDSLFKLLLEEEARIKAQFKVKPPRICAVMLAFYQENEDWYLPMMVRPDKSRVHPGQIAFPGGKQEEEDIDLHETAIREMLEEVGVEVPRKNILGALSNVYIPPSNALVTPIVGFLEQKPSYIPDADEVAEVFDVRVKDLLNPANKTHKSVVMANGEHLKFPAFQIEDKLIWGGTARMISELNKLLTELEHF